MWAELTRTHVEMFCTARQKKLTQKEVVMYVRSAENAGWAVDTCSQQTGHYGEKRNER